MKTEKIYFNPDEVRSIALGLGRVVDDINAMKRGEYADTPWTPEARKIQGEILKHARTAAANWKSSLELNVTYRHISKVMKMNF